MKKYLMFLFCIFFISLVSGLPVISDITINPSNPDVTESVRICANVTDSASAVIIVRVNLQAQSPSWNWGLVMSGTGDNYCEDLAPQLLGSYDGKVMDYYITARNLVNELAMSATSSFTYGAVSSCGDGTCDANESCGTCWLDCTVGCGVVQPEVEEEEEEDDDVTTYTMRQYCDPSWKCTAWTPCIRGFMTRDCDDVNHCRLSYNKPIEELRCHGNEEVFVGNNYSSIYVACFVGAVILFALIILLVVLVRR